MNVHKSSSIHLSEETNFDIIIIVSSRITSPVRVLGSVVRRLIDSIGKPVLLIHE